MHNNQFIIVGKIGAPYGIKGWVKITSFTEVISSICEYNPWYLMDGGAWQPITVTSSREHGKGIVAKLAGYDTPEAVRILTGKEIAVMHSQLPQLKEHEYYWYQLEGLTVINYTGETLGKVSYLMETGANDVLVVKGDKEIAIPYLLGKVITEIDLPNQLMRVHWDMI